MRFTQEEYQTLERISRGQGANSVSEYLRQLVMKSDPVVALASEKTHEFAEELNELKRRVDRLSQIVTQALSAQSFTNSIPDMNEPTGGELAQQAASD